VGDRPQLRALPTAVASAVPAAGRSGTAQLIGIVVARWPTTLSLAVVLAVLVMVGIAGAWT